MPSLPLEHNAKDNDALGGVPAPVLFAGGFAAGFALQLLMSIPLAPRRLARALGFVSVGAGVGLIAWAVDTMRRAETSPNPHVASSAVVQDGPFAYTRNPIYVGYALLHAGAALMANALWPILALQPVLRLLVRHVIEPEEVYMEERFGSDYSGYKEAVPRWL